MRCANNKVPAWAYMHQGWDYLAGTLSGEDDVRDELHTDKIDEDACDAAPSMAGAEATAAAAKCALPRF